MSVSSFWWASRASVLAVSASPPPSYRRQNTERSDRQRRRSGKEMKSDKSSPTSPNLCRSCPLLPQTKIQIQIFFFCFLSFFVCLVLVPLSCSGEVNEELFMKQPEWERAYASVWVCVHYFTLPSPLPVQPLPLNLSHFFDFLPKRRWVLIVRNRNKEQDDLKEMEMGEMNPPLGCCGEFPSSTTQPSIWKLVFRPFCVHQLIRFYRSVCSLAQTQTGNNAVCAFVWVESEGWFEHAASVHELSVHGCSIEHFLLLSASERWRAGSSSPMTLPIALLLFWDSFWIKFAH